MPYAPSALLAATRLLPGTLLTDGSCLVSPGACRGSELLREVAWVVFDEVHYMQDRERGVVWEETIIFLNDECKMVRRSSQ